MDLSVIPMKINLYILEMAILNFEGFSIDGHFLIPFLHSNYMQVHGLKIIHKLH